MSDTIQIQGLEELNRRILFIKEQFDGPPMKRLCLKACRVLATEVQRRIKRGPTGNLLKAVQVATGRKAWKQGAAAIVRINAWLAPHAHLIEAGTKEFQGGVMRIPLSAVSPEWWAALPQDQKIEAGKRGYVFITRRKGAPAQHPFRDGVQATLPQARQVMEDGLKQAMQDALK